MRKRTVIISIFELVLLLNFKFLVSPHLSPHPLDRPVADAELIHNPHS